MNGASKIPPIKLKIFDDTQEGLEAVTSALQVAGFGEYSDDFANLI